MVLCFFFVGLNILSAQVDQHCDEKSRPFTKQTNHIKSNEKYCVHEDLIITNLTIEDGGVLYLSKGKKLKISGNYSQKGGHVVIDSQAQLLITGGTELGAFGSQKDAIIELMPNAYVSVTGSLSINDPSRGGYYKHGKSFIKMNDNSMLEICGTMDSKVSTYPIVEYIGKGTNKAIIINRAQVAGGHVLTHSNKIDWITLSTVSFLLPGNANWCGENAQNNCLYWPRTFDATKDCGILILPNEGGTKKKQMISNPMIHLYPSKRN